MASTNTHSTSNMSLSGSAAADNVDSFFAAAGPRSMNEERAERSEIQHWRLQYKQCFDQLERERNAFADGIAKARKEAEKVFAEELELLREQVKAFKVDKEKRALATLLIDKALGEKHGDGGEQDDEESKLRALRLRLEDTAAKLAQREVELDARERGLEKTSSAKRGVSDSAGPVAAGRVPHAANNLQDIELKSDEGEDYKAPDSSRPAVAGQSDPEDDPPPAAKSLLRADALVEKAGAHVESLHFWECVHPRGVAYRANFGDFESRVLSKLGPRFQEVIACCEYREGWVRTPDDYWLPIEVGDAKVLEPFNVEGNTQSTSTFGAFPTATGSTVRAAHDYSHRVEQLRSPVFDEDPQGGQSSSGSAEDVDGEGAEGGELSKRAGGGAGQNMFGGLWQSFKRDLNAVEPFPVARDVTTQ
eukprot:g8805.t1